MIQTIPSQLSGVLPTNSISRLILSPKSLESALRDPPEPLLSPYLVLPIVRLSEFIAYLEIMHERLHWTRKGIFRGHADASWKLVPSLMREDVLSKEPQSTEIEALEDELLDEFERRALPLMRNPPQGPAARWRWAALAQHHKLPTRFLDWTYRPTTALFFAVGFEPQQKYHGFSCVWAIQSPPNYREVQLIHAASTQTGQKFIPTEAWPTPQRDKNLPVCIFDPPHVSPRITMQQACFTVHPSHYQRLFFEWIEGIRIIFLIESDVRLSLRASLERIGLNREVLFPDLDGIAAHLAEIIPPSHRTTVHKHPRHEYRERDA